MRAFDCFIAVHALERKKTRYLHLGSVPVLLAFAPPADAQGTETSRAKTTMPTTENFMSALGTCAAGMNLHIEANLTGSVKQFFEGQKAEGSIWVENAPDLLKLFPDADKITAYKLYTECIRGMRLAEKGLDLRC